MSQATVVPSVAMRNSAFGGLAAAVLALVLLETGFLLLEATARVHIVSILMGGALIALMLRRFLQCWPTNKNAAPANAGERRQLRMAGGARLASCALVGGAGYVAADTLSAGFVSGFMIFACGLVFIPWTRIARTRADCLGYGVVAVLGVSVPLFMGYPRFHPILLPAVTWLLWVSTMAAWMRLVLDEKRMQRLAGRSAGHDSHRSQGGRSHRAELT